MEKWIMGIVTSVFLLMCEVSKQLWIALALVMWLLFSTIQLGSALHTDIVVYRYYNLVSWYNTAVWCVWLAKMTNFAVDETVPLQENLFNWLQLLSKSYYF